MSFVKPKTFVDFCAGVGAGRVGLERNGLNCLGFSEINPLSELTYRTFFGDQERNYGDLMAINPSQLPDFDLMIAGFPCQTFSIVGLRQGMLDERGQIIYGLVRILREKNVPFFILENVKGLVNHEKGETMARVIELLEEADYKVSYRVLNSIDFGVPQLRERIYFVGIRNDISTLSAEFEWPSSLNAPPVEDFFERNPRYLIEPLSQTFQTFLRYLNNRYNAGRFELAELLAEDDLVLDTRQSDLRLYRGRVPTLRTGRHGIYYVFQGGLFRLSPSEAFRLQGFPEELSKLVEGCNSGTSLLSQAGNAMTVNVIEAIAKSLIRFVEIS